ncbi:Presenilin [Ancylostoma duodenale]|uniref:Presenilin n=1 Tax=Ancylostoma duodenale TaxID=51022 RepID=A0A0C2CPM3_9BILA|nr:Presenilin [Ancylostoma duodenale]
MGNKCADRRRRVFRRDARSVRKWRRHGGLELIAAQRLYTPFVKETDSASEKVLMSLGNALVMLCVVVFMTVILIFFYKYRCYKFYLISMSALMALVFIKYLPEWTVWSVLAVISVWDLIAVLAPNGPLRILVETAQERNEPIFPALIYSSGMVYSFVFTGALEGEDNPAQTNPPASSSEESTPSTSGLLATSGASAVRVKRFAPQRSQKPEKAPGDILLPLRSQEAARSLNEVPRTQNARVNQPNLVRRDQEEKGVKLGLGDFIFYSVLVGKASSYFDWNTTVACYVAILVGLCFTLVLLAVFRRALPALPISIFAGLLFYFCTRWIVTPYVSELTRRQWIY